MPPGGYGQSRNVSDFSLRTEGTQAGTTEVVVAGDLDMAAAFRLESELDRLFAAPGNRGVSLDLGEVAFVDSAGLGALLAVQDRAAQLGVGFRIARASDAVQRILDLTGTRNVLGA